MTENAYKKMADTGIANLVLGIVAICSGIAFESLVSFEGCKTLLSCNFQSPKFESLVSFEGCKTSIMLDYITSVFESLVSFEGCKTGYVLNVA